MRFEAADCQAASLLALRHKTEFKTAAKRSTDAPSAVFGAPSDESIRPHQHSSRGRNAVCRFEFARRDPSVRHRQRNGYRYATRDCLAAAAADSDQALPSRPVSNTKLRAEKIQSGNSLSAFLQIDVRSASARHCFRLAWIDVPAGAARFLRDHRGGMIHISAFDVEVVLDRLHVVGAQDTAPNASHSASTPARR